MTPPFSSETAGSRELGIGNWGEGNRADMLWRMLKTLIMIGIGISLALTLLQAFLFSKMAHP